MSIQVTCQCGKQLTAKDEFAGKRVKCPGCGGPLLIPRPQAQQASASADAANEMSDLLDDAGVRTGIARCPGCGAELAEEAVLCVLCGYDLRRGHRIKTRVGSAVELDGEELGDLPVHGVAQLDAAERALARDKIEQKHLGKGVPWWVVFLAFIGLVGFAGGMIAMPQDQVVRNSGYILMVAGSLMVVYFSLRLYIDGFKEAALHGILMVIFPPYILYFIFSRWDREGGIFIFYVIGLLLCGIGYCMVQFLVPFFESLGEDNDKGRAALWQLERPAVVMNFQDITRI